MSIKLTSSYVTNTDSPIKLNKPNKSQVGLLSTAISRLGDSNITKQSTLKQSNMSPIRTTLFRDHTPKTKGMEGVVVGDYHILTPTHVVFSSIYKSTSPHRSSRNYNESPQRTKFKLDRFKQWDSKLGIELQLQNTKFTRLNNELTYQSYQPTHQSTRSAIFLGGSNLNRLSQSGQQSDIRILAAKLNSIPPSQIGTFASGHSHELSSLQQSLTRILKH